ncbi:hypothetical protein [Marilutibacter spongiae]|uniref:Uncharacterized protein n=1 Tax=Marilutibacter spongiae TaxID=2025720 RepID=A0A7W3Y6N1_9GAMM|nr:hypothetical protein [Lysobacter spongiae]MBB1061200.1 hypothetical protein [Lysobacter spongiae]
MTARRSTRATSRRILPVVLLLVACAFAPAWGQDDWSPRTGDAWVDAWLGDMNRYGASYPDAFIDEIVRYQEAPRALVRELLLDRGWRPGDVYYACGLAAVSGRPCRHVADRWQRDAAGGWGAIAVELGVEPGSAAFMRLKKGFVPSYDRWGRPIRVDDALAREFPGRERMPAPAGNDVGEEAKSGN